MPRAKITKTRLTGITRVMGKRVLDNQKNYEILLNMSTTDFLRIRAMEFLTQGDLDKAMDMLILDKIMA